MDLKENIRKAAEVYQHQKCYVDKGIAEECIDCFIAGAKSQAAKDYWYNEFKRECTAIKLTDQEKLDIEYSITLLGRQHRQYLKDNPDKPMSFDDWKYMIENYKGESSNIIHKHIGIIGHVNHGKIFTVGLGLRESQKGLIVMDMDTPLTPEERFEVMENLKPDLSAIKSIVPIADVVPEPLFLTKNDYPGIDDLIKTESQMAWKIKKQKKVYHKRNNKRK